MHAGKVVILGSCEKSKKKIKGANAHFFASKKLIGDTQLNVDFDVVMSVRWMCSGMRNEQFDLYVIMLLFSFR